MLIFCFVCCTHQYTAPDEVAVCNLASINLSLLANEDTGEFDFDMLKKISKTLTYNLNKIIDRNYYPVEEARNSNMRHRPIGIGVQVRRKREREIVVGSVFVCRYVIC